MTTLAPLCFLPIVGSIIYVLLMTYAAWRRERRWARGLYGYTEWADRVGDRQ